MTFKSWVLEKRFDIAVWLAVLSAFGTVVWFFATIRSELTDARIRISGLESGTKMDQQLEGAITKIEEAAIKHGRNPLPLGSIVAFYGSIVQGENGIKGLPIGYLLCNGELISTLEHPELCEFLSKTNPGLVRGETVVALPNFQGTFLRGVDPGGVVDKESMLRTKDILGEDKVGALVGSWQSDSTALPNIPFVTANDGAHSHKIAGGNNNTKSDGTRVDTSPNPDSDHTRISGGNHSHKLVGGDFETRPVNVAVHFLIKH